MSEFYDKLLDLKKNNDVYIIAEIGSNWYDLHHCKNAIGLAKNCGADAVKFQYFTKQELFGYRDIRYNELPLAWIPELKEKADAFKIDFLCSAFSPKGIEEINPYVQAHKIASCEMAHIRMLEKIIQLQKPLFLSTGAYFPADIQRTIEFLKNSGFNKIIPMHCNVSYPAEFADLEKFEWLKSYHPQIYGYSDHSLSIDVIPKFFQTHGCTVFEEHFNPNDLDETDDSKHSCTITQFQAFVNTLRGKKVNYSEENQARLRNIRRVVAIQDIKPGDVLQENINMGIFRTEMDDSNGINPFFIHMLEGLTSNSNLKPGQGISLINVKSRRIQVPF